MAFKRTGIVVLLLILSSAFVSQTSAITGGLSFSGEITNSDPGFEPRLFRLGPDCNTGPLGAIREYDRYDFTVPSSGSYDFVSSRGTIDRLAFYIYEGSFDPMNSAANCIEDGFNPGADSTVTVPLTAGTTYTLVAIGSRGGDKGTYSIRVNISTPDPVVEPPVVPDMPEEDPGPRPIFFDGRINDHDSAAPVVVYPARDNTGLDIYSAEGQLLLVVTGEQIALVSATPGVNTLIASNSAAGVFVSRQGDGSFLVQAPQYNGKTYLLTFDLIGENVGYTSREVG